MCYSNEKYEATIKSRISFEKSSQTHYIKSKSLAKVTTEKRRNYLVSEPNHHTKTFFRENLTAIEMRKTEPVYLRFSILDLIKTIMYEF